MPRESETQGPKRLAKGQVQTRSKLMRKTSALNQEHHVHYSHESLLLLWLTGEKKRNACVRLSTPWSSSAFQTSGQVPNVFSGTVSHSAATMWSRLGSTMVSVTVRTREFPNVQICQMDEWLITILSNESVPTRRMAAECAPETLWHEHWEIGELHAFKIVVVCLSNEASSNKHVHNCSNLLCQNAAQTLVG